MNTHTRPAHASTADTPLAIIGIGCLFPKANDTNGYWSNIAAGIDAISDIPASHWRPEDYYDQDQKSPDRTYGHKGGFLSAVDFNPMEFNIPPATLEAIDSAQLLGLVAAGQALKDAGYGPDRQFDRARTSVILGVTGTLELVIPLGARLGHPIWRNALKDAGVDQAVAEDVVQRIGEAYVAWQENSFPGLLGNVVAGRISKQYDLGGTNCVVDAACASSLGAIHLAGMELASGKSDLVITGGVDTFNDIFMYLCFSKTPALSPSGHAKPFDSSADGTTLGEGLGIVVLKRLADAQRDGDRIYAVIRGIGSSSDGKGEAIYTPSAQGQQKAVRAAYVDAGITPDSIGLLEAHGTGTRVGDGVEVSALREVYGEAERPWCALGSVKSQIGHTKAAAGAAGLIKAALSLYHKVLPPTIKVEQPLDEVVGGRTPFYLNSVKRPWLHHGPAPRRAAVSALGFGGSNFHVVLEEYGSQRSVVDWGGDVQLIPLSAATPQLLDTALAALPNGDNWQELRSVAAAARRSFDPRAACRLSLVAERTQTPLSSLVANARTQLAKNPASDWSLPDGTSYGCGAEPGSLGLLFPGQGAQYTGMLRDLACRFPELLETVSAADSGYREATGGLLSDLIYPPSPFDQATRTAQEAALTATDAAQPAIGAVSLGAFKLLSGFGLQPAAAAGHSYGELTALSVAGRFDEPALHHLSRLRGRLMADGGGDKGSMLAVAAPLATVEQLLADEKLDLVIANRNAPNQAVLSGPTPEIERAVQACAVRKLTAKQLPVAAAFHSRLVADAATPLHAALERIEISAGSIPVYANTTAAVYPAEPAATRQLLANQLACPVEFTAQIEAMHAAGIRTFLEVGPGARLTGLVGAILGEQQHSALALDSSSGKRSGLADLARVLGRLAALGYALELTRWDGDYQAPAAPAKKPLLTVPICGANYVKPKPKRPATPPRPQATVVAAAAPATASAAPVMQPFAQLLPGAAPEALAESLRVTREGMAALQRMQEETAQLHRRFLEGQETAARTIQTLLAQQQSLLQGGGMPLPQLSVPAAAPPAPPVVQTVTAPPLAPVVAPAPAAPSLSNAVTETLLAVVSEKTGYPLEMLELEMGLDSDLGIDSIKRVEILSALQEKLPGAPVIGPEQLGTLRTLGDIATYLGAGSAPLVAAAVPSLSNAVTETLLAVVSEKTGYPLEMLELEMGLDSDLGIDSIKRVEILSALQEKLPGSPVIGPEQLGTLRTLGDIAAYLGAGAAPVAIAAVLSGAGSAVTETLLGVVSEKTGYPLEMLELEMGLDSDLGIDSIKRVEILSALQEKLPGAPVIGPEQLGTLRTLGDIAAYLGGGAAPSVAASAATAPRAASGSAPTGAAVTETLLTVVSEKTGYPIEMLELGMGMDSDLGIDSIKRVEILSALQEKLPGSPVIGPEHLGTLRTLGDIAAYLGGAAGQAPLAVAPQPAPAAEPAKAAVPLQPVNRSAIRPQALPAASEPLQLAAHGEIWITNDGSSLGGELCGRLQAAGRKARLVGLDEPCTVDELAGLVILAPVNGSDDLFLENAFLLLKQAAPALRRAADNGGALVATVSRLDGSFGCGEETHLADPLSGGLAGLSKTAAREWQEVTCRAIDLGGFESSEAASTALAEELLRSGPLEVGLTPDGRSMLELVDLPALEQALPAPIQAGEVVVVTGGGRGVTAAAAVALAKAYQPLLVLLGRSSELQPEPAWLAGLQEEAAIKRAILEHAASKLHPREIEEQYRAIVAGRELRETLAQVTAAGGTAVYRSADIRDAAAVSRLMEEIRREYGPIRGLVHGAGVLADRLIVDKTLEQFAQVYGTKVIGLRSLLAATAADQLRFIALFGSTTGRLGRTGQVDYAVANEVLNKLAQAESRRRPGCRTVCINWGPWDGGMVTPALKKVFANEGIGLIPLEAGAELLVRELAAPAEPVEVVALVGRLDKERIAVPGPATAKPLAEVLTMRLSVEEYPFLRSHVMDNKAVLPMAMMVEWLSHAALHGNPGFRFHGFNDLRICKGLIFEHNQPYSVRLLAGKAEKREALYHVKVELVGSLPDGRPLVHARGEVVLANQLPKGIRVIPDPPAAPYTPLNGHLYDPQRLFHGPDLQGIVQVESCSAKGISALVKAAPQPSQWIARPLRSDWLTDPLVLDSAYQMMILWSFDRFGSGSLPCFAARYRQFSDSFPRDGVQVVIRVTAEREHGATADMEFLDRANGKLVARLEGYECVIDPSLARAFQLNRLPEDDAARLSVA